MGIRLVGHVGKPDPPLPEGRVRHGDAGALRHLVALRPHPQLEVVAPDVELQQVVAVGEALDGFELPPSQASALETLDAHLGRLRAVRDRHEVPRSAPGSVHDEEQSPPPDRAPLDPHGHFFREHILQEDRYGQEDVAELEERIESLERRAETFRMRLRAYEVISEVLEEARQNILGSISGQVDERIGAYFALITDGKYDQVRLSRQDFSLRVLSREKGDWINPDSEELSAGAKDQLYLAARLALVDTVSSGNAMPLILDDPLVHFDSSRRENTQKLLKEISKTHQVLLFSCHDYYNKWADQVIEF